MALNLWAGDAAKNVNSFYQPTIRQETNKNLRVVAGHLLAEFHSLFFGMLHRRNLRVKQKTR